jgi:simple sugar transport system ATP-binding protein
MSDNALEPNRKKDKPKQPLVSMRGITKAFPNVLANDGIDFDVFPGEIHALLGENGAGKSTLVKILYGFYQEDAGEIYFEGKRVDIRSPHDAKLLRLGMVFQDFTLIPAFSVAENIALFLLDLPTIVDTKKICDQINDLSSRHELEVDPLTKVSQLSIGQQQKVEILKLLLSEAHLLILDEPTRVLAPHEKQALFRVLESLSADGYAIILITHKMSDVLEISDRITILRGGRVAGSMLRSEASEEKLVSMMFGQRLSDLRVERTHAPKDTQLPLLELRQVATRGEGAQTSLSEINLKVFPGEIVGVAGVSGNGQRELGDVILGMISCAEGERYLSGKDMTRASIREIRSSGVSFIPESPLGMAAAPYLTVLENMAVPQTKRYSRNGGFKVDWQAVRDDTETSMQSLGYSLPLNVPARSLSGGNLQRMIIVRELMHNPKLIIASYLTRGLDVQSVLAARRALAEARQQGAGVLLISEDLEELFEMSDRLIVLYDGAIVGRFAPSETSYHEIGYLMTGAKDGDATIE